MSGHSKWATIKRAKGKSDAAKAKVFTKIGRELAVAVKQGGPDPNSNARLRDVIYKAKSANMPNDNISRSIKKASGELGSINYDTVVYEGYGLEGVAVIVETLTDNKNRTAADVRHIFDKNGGALGTNGCVSYLFETSGLILCEKQGKSDDDVMLEVLECGAADFSAEGDMYEIITAATDIAKVREELEGLGYKISESSIEKIPATKIKITAIERFNKMLDMFDENDDVQNVYHNADLPEAEDEE